jgi:hypothetical protein
MRNSTTIQLKPTTWLVIAVVLAIAATGWSYEDKSNNQNGVRVQVTPVVLSPNKPAEFKIRLNTHSGNLGQDLTLVAELRDDQGRSYKALEWRGSPPGGHHRSGDLTFEALNDTAREVTLIIREVGGVDERAFSWKI